MIIGRILRITVFLITFLLTKAYSQRHVESHLLTKNIEGLAKESGTNYFIVVGDWGRNGQGDQQSVADWMGVAADQVTARFVISTGDNFYCCGVASTDDYQWLSSFEHIYRCHSLQIPWYVSLGNHDYQGNVNAQIDYSKRNQRWKMPSRYFTFANNGIRFVAIDTSPFIKSYHKDARQYGDLTLQDTTRQMKWLDSVLTAAPEKVKIVFGHHPLYSLGDHGDANDLKPILERRLEHNHVLIYFAGHDHGLQTIKPTSATVRHIISGGGSEHTMIKENPLLSPFAKGTSGFIVVGQKGNQLTMYYIDNNGKILYKETVL